jgi:hypothetical protein
VFHATEFQPRVNPCYNDVAGSQIDRAQDLRASVTLNRVKVKELGNEDLVCWKKGIPTNSITLRQLEYGELKFWQQLANEDLSGNSITASDYKVALSDLSVFLTDDIGIFRGTLWYPEARISTFSLNIGSPDDLIERNFTLVNENEIIFQNDNKYVVYLKFTATGNTGQTFTIGAGDYAAYPDAEMDPDNSGQYFLRCYRYRSSDSTNELMVEGTDYTFNSGTGTVTIDDDSVSTDDIFIFVYTATDYISGEVPFTANTSDLCAIKADECDILLVTDDRVSRLQSISFDCNFDRLDIKEIGTTDVVAYGSRDITTTVNLGQIVDTWLLDEAMRDVIGESYGKLDVREYNDDMVVKIKIYTDNTKTTFKMGYRLNNLSPTSIDDGNTVEDYATRNTALEGDSVLITSDEATLDA